MRCKACVVKDKNLQLFVFSETSENHLKDKKHLFFVFRLDLTARVLDFRGGEKISLM